ncbi:MAG: glycosyltransferase family 4 protein [Saprospiraceae bacterium]|nr:glycosyltransferase family 4 protein [Saprospiraceae bacterium]
MESEKIILFAGRRERKVKNFDLARKAVDFSGADRLIELKDFNRSQVAKLINACDCVLLTSKSEGSPMIIKEALACGCPIVSVDVGDIKELSDGIDGVFISGFDFKFLAENIDKALKFSYSNFSNKLSYIDNTIIAQKILNIYKKIAYKKIIMSFYIFRNYTVEHLFARRIDIVGMMKFKIFLQIAI